MVKRRRAAIAPAPRPTGRPLRPIPPTCRIRAGRAKPAKQSDKAQPEQSADPDDAPANADDPASADQAAADKDAKANARTKDRGRGGG